MVVIGAMGHAKEILDLLEEKEEVDNLHFFDNVTETENTRFFNFPIIKDYSNLERVFNSDPRFILGLGGTVRRRKLVEKFQEVGGLLAPAISRSSNISKICEIEVGVNIMPFSTISRDVIIGKAVLVHSYCSIHHDSIIGEYSEISPGARILGYCKVGEMCSIGTNAVILPGVSITDNVTVGAGAVVTKNITEPGVYVGAPSKKIDSNGI